jgi:hypothetical protein
VICYQMFPKELRHGGYEKSNIVRMLSGHQ